MAAFYPTRRQGYCLSILCDAKKIEIKRGHYIVVDFESDTSTNTHIVNHANVDILITSLGANCMNLIFGNSPRYCILLSNDHPLGEHYYTSLSSELNTHPIQTIHIQSPSDPNYFDPLNSMNAAFTVPIDTVVSTIQRIQPTEIHT